MASLSDDDISRIIAGYGVSQSEFPPTASDLTQISLESLIESREDPLFSSGHLRFLGTGIVSNSIDLKSIGGFMAGFQTLVTRLVAKKLGIDPKTKVAESASKMSLQASPLPGSVVLKVTPTQAVVGAAQQQGIDGFESDLDAAFFQVMELFDTATNVGPDMAPLLELLMSLGTESCSTIRRLTKILKTEQIDVEVVWRMPHSASKRKRLLVKDSILIHDLVKRRNLDQEILELSGIVSTASVDKSVILALTLANGDQVDLYADKEVHVNLNGVTLGDEVTIQARKTERGMGEDADSSRYTLLEIELS